MEWQTWNEVAALMGSHVIGLQPFQKAIEQTTENTPKQCSSSSKLVIVTSLQELLHCCNNAILSVKKEKNRQQTISESRQQLISLEHKIPFPKVFGKLIKFSAKESEQIRLS